MNIIIVGGGKVGITLTKKLSEEGHDVTVIDNDPQAISNVTDSMDVITVEGNGASMEILKMAGADKMDLLIAVTPQDELNIYCCIVAKKLGITQTIARVRNPEYSA
ncbi:MAG: NAD-binding protein, partial [Christensenellaceae bacterium]|nr:NAD-binding protein [Christensenellaceae bacterium]